MTHADMIEALRAGPDDQLLHLAYADWLDERGDDDGAALVRLQVEWDRQPAGSAERAALDGQARERHAAVSRRLGPFLALPYEQYRWGAVHRLALTSARTWTEARALLRHHPIASLRVEGEGALADLAGSPLLRGITELEASHQPRRAAPLLDRLFTSPHLGPVRSLSLAGPAVDNHLARALAGSPGLAGLRRLKLSSSALSDAGVVSLLRPGALPALEGWDVQAPATAVAFAHLFRPEHAGRWRSLALYGDWRSWPGLVDGLPRCRCLRSLALTVSPNYPWPTVLETAAAELEVVGLLGEWWLRGLAAWPGLRRLCRLTLRRVTVPDAEAREALRGSPHFPPGLELMLAG